MAVRFTVFRFTVLLVIAHARPPSTDPPPIHSELPAAKPSRSDAKSYCKQMLMPWAEDYTP